MRDSTNKTPKVDVPAVFGFEDFFEGGDGSERFMFAKDDSRLGGKLLTADTLAKLLKEDPKIFGEAISVTQGKEYREPTEEELVGIRQCALITRLFYESDGQSFQNYFNQTGFTNSPLNPDNENYSRDRILPVDPQYDPNLFYNKCNISLTAKDTFAINETQSVDSPTTLYKSLWWVFESNDGLKEINLPFSKNEVEKKEAISYYKLLNAQRINNNESLTDDQKKSRIKSLLGKDYARDNIDDDLKKIRDKDSSFNESGEAYYYLQDIEIKYEGTNPSTSRNDVQVQITFGLSSLKALQCVMATIPREYSDTVEDPEIKLYELITLPVTNKISKGPGAYLKNQFNPEYSRVRLKVFNGVDHKSDLIIDLSTIDHSINRSSDTGNTTLTINYRGFFEAMMNMPFNDALADEETLKRRENLHNQAMSVIKTKDCKPELINRAMRIEQEIFRREAASLSAGSILRRLTMMNSVHSYTLKEDLVKARAFNGTLDASRDYVDEVVPMGGGITEEQAAQTADPKNKSDDETDKKDLDFAKNKFFFLGDLLYVVSQCLYSPSKPDEMRAVVKNMNLRFILGSINVPNPKNRDGSMITLNPACIPVDMTYFIEWFNSTIVNKGLTTYPVGLFIKELVERLINNIIFEVCFSSLLPSENPPVIRVQFASDFNDKGWFRRVNGWFNPNRPRGATKEDLYNQLTGDGARNDNDENLFTRNALFNSEENKKVFDVSPYNYCVIYQQFPTFSHYTMRDKTQKLRNKPFVPTIFYGAKNTNFNYVSNVSFSKTTSPFLREARYFNSNYGNLSLLSNVYDLNFSFIKRKANTFFYPGIIINFVLLDWDSTGEESPYVTLINNSSASGNEPTSDDYAVFGQANPHSEKTLAHILGFGGYYIIKSVVYKLGQTEADWEINITTKFLGTDAAKNDRREIDADEAIEDKEECVQAFDKLATRAREISGEDDEYFRNAIVETENRETREAEAEEDTKEEPTTEKVAEITPTPIEPPPTQTLTDQEEFNKIIIEHFQDLEYIEQADLPKGSDYESKKGSWNDFTAGPSGVFEYTLELMKQKLQPYAGYTGWFKSSAGKFYYITFSANGHIYVFMEGK